MRDRSILVFLLGLLLATAALASPYNTPIIDGHVTVGGGDWDIDEWVVDDSPYDCRWGASDPDLDDLYVTWDGDALYVGMTTANLPSPYGSGYLIYIDTDGQNGITGATDFTYADYYARRVTFSTMGVDVLAGAWNLDPATIDVRHCSDPTSTVHIDESFGDAHPYWPHLEIVVSWNGLYGLGWGHVPPGATLRFIAAIVGGEPSGAYDAMPSSSTGFETDPSNPWDSYTDLDVYFEVAVDTDGDGYPDSGATPVETMSWARIKSMFRR